MSTKKVIAFDIETIADRSMVPILPEVVAAGNLKDPAKIAADIEAKKQRQLLDMGLDPLTNIICVFGWADGENSGTIILPTNENGVDNEKALLLQAWDILGHYDHFITFNGRSFDLRCLLLHGITHQVRPSVSIDAGRYNRPGGNHTDLRSILAGEGPFAKGKLDFFARKFLGADSGKTEGIDGSLVQSYWDMGLIDDVAAYCQHDAEITYQLWLRCEAAGLIE
jgi:predicted PolB exonuclease-like 3'-5' exonuclease